MAHGRLGLTLLAPGCAAHSGRAAAPLRAWWEDRGAARPELRPSTVITPPPPLIASPQALLAAQDESDAALMRDFETFDPEQLASHGVASSTLLGACRARLAQCKTRLRTAADVTSGLKTRLNAAVGEAGAIEVPLEALHAALPHRDGTPLEVEPCVPTLHKLLDDLDGLKADSAASLAAAHAAEQQQQREAHLGERLLQQQLAGTIEQATASKIV